MSIHYYKKEPSVKVGIVSGRRVVFSLNGRYAVGGAECSGVQEAVLANGFIHWRGKPHTELLFEPLDAAASFSIQDVTIGVNFHWERKETQTFLGSLRLKAGIDGTQTAQGGRIWAINELPVESYLESVISSEMSATSNLPLLMAHAVISRSWLMAQMEASPSPSKRRDGLAGVAKGTLSPLLLKGADEASLIRWYDHTDHTLFDVCADDHCQRYQGITKETSRHVAEAIERTRGQILAYGGEVCDTRFSKCCGGMMEEFQYCWDDTPKPYLKGKRDQMLPRSAAGLDLTVEENAEKWIRSTPESFCNTNDKEILWQVLNDYDQKTSDFYRWHVDYTQDELSELVSRKLGVDFGQIVDLVPMKRGTSGRIYELKIVGTKRTMTIGKELEIRRALSESHLYSSAFVVEKQNAPLPGGKGSGERFFRLIGAGWGHGVGLCQIGAAVMGAKGYDYDKILSHYYSGTTLEKAW